MNSFCNYFVFLYMIITFVLVTFYALKRVLEPFNRLSFEKRLKIKEEIKHFQRNQTKSNAFQTAEFSLSVLLIA